MSALHDLSQALADGTVCSLAEIAALRMLQMGFAADYGNLQIGNFRSGQNTRMLPFFQMSPDQPLPVGIKLVTAYQTVESHAASRLTGFQQKLCFRIVAQRLEMSDTDCGP